MNPKRKGDTMTTRFFFFLRRIFRRELVLAPVPVRSLLVLALTGLTVMAMSPQVAAAQRSSTSRGSTERKVERSSSTRSSSKGRSSSKARATGAATKAVGKAIRSAARSGDSGNTSGRSATRQVERAASSASRGAAVDRGAKREGERANRTSDAAASRDTRTGRDVQARQDNRSDRDSRAVRSNADNRAASGRVGARVMDRSDNGRVAAARGATSANRRDGRIVLNGDRSRLSIPGVRATWRSDAHRHVRYRTRLTLAPSFYYVRPSSRIHVHVAWPWEVRYHRHWSPRYRYRQVVIVRSDWGRSYRESRIEMETTYRHRVRYANADYAVLDIDVEQIAIYDNGRFLGMVEHIPSHLSSIEATVFRNGDIAFDRDLFLVGDRRAGFEIISTEFDDGFAGQGYRYGDDIRVGRVDLKRGRVRSADYSRLFDPNRWQGFAPISLLPEDEGWLWDFGADAISAANDDYDAYYGYGDSIRGGYRSEAALSTENRFRYDAAFGASFNVERKAEIRRVE